MAKRSASAQNAQTTTPSSEALPQSAYRVELMDLDDCIKMRHLKNPKEHDVPALIASFKRFKFVAPPTIDEATQIMVAGHGRCLGLSQMKADGEPAPGGIVALGDRWLVPILRGISFENERERDAYVIADNQHTIHGGWNLDKLTEVLESLRPVGFDGMGFDELDLQSFGITGEELGALADDVAGDETPTTNNPIATGSKHSIDAEVFNEDALYAATFKHYRETGFPYADPAPQECMQEINRLASMPLDALVRSNVAYGVADKFQRHRFAASAENKRSPLDSFGDDDQLRRCIELSIKYEGSLTDGAIRGVISLVKNTQQCSNFRPGFAAHIYRRFCPPGGVVLDTSTGYGGRLVGAIASTVVKHYIGIDPNPPTVAGNRKMLAMLGREEFATLIQSPAEDVDESTLRERCDFAFTSPPYFRKEHYSDDDTQSWKRYPEAESWREGFLVKMVRLTAKALKPNATCAINIGDVLIDNVRHPLGDWTMDAAKRCGLDHVATLEFPMARRFGSNQKEEVATEPVFIFRKPA